MWFGLLSVSFPADYKEIFAGFLLNLLDAHGKYFLVCVQSKEMFQLCTQLTGCRIKVLGC